MKRRLLALSLILIVALAAVGANQFTENILDRELPPLLSDALGLPVFLKPTSVNLLTLGASSPELIMGDRNNPTIVAQQVRVRLSWKSLLRGEIRFVYAQATDLMVSVFRWPSNDNPWPEDYQFLDQWIPEAMQVDSARYLRADNSAYPVTDARWARLPGGSARASWLEQRQAGEIAVGATLHSLRELLL